MCLPSPEALLFLKEAMESSRTNLLGMKAGAAHSGPVSLDYVMSMEEGTWVWLTWVTAEKKA